MDIQRERERERTMEIKSGRRICMCSVRLYRMCRETKGEGEIDRDLICCTNIYNPHGVATALCICATPVWNPSDIPAATHDNTSCKVIQCYVYVTYFNIYVLAEYICSLYAMPHVCAVIVDDA